MAKIIAVVGATGVQGGGLARAILADPSGGFSVRAITRDPNKDNAKALAAKGAEVVSANLDIAEAAKAAGVKHVIWSTLEDTRKLMSADDKRMPMLQEKYRVPHFDAKAEADAFFQGVPTTFLRTSFYWDNLFMFGLAPKKNEQGQYAWAFPMGTAKLGGIAAEDIGKTAYGIFKAGDKYVGQTVGIYGEALTISEMGEKLSKGLGMPSIYYHAAEADEYRGYGFPGADEMGNMFQVYRDFEKQVLGARSVETARALNPALQNFDQFIAKNKAKIEAAANPAPAGTPA
jgi:uncharacterized protein YbjT (DUF2867 family)